MFSLSNIVCAFLPDQMGKTYKGEIQFAEKMLYSGVALGKLHPLTKSSAKTADTALRIFKSLVYVEKGLKSCDSLPKVRKAKTTSNIITFSSIVLLPFSVIGLVENAIPLNFVHSIFKQLPVFGVLKFGGITNFAIITLSSALLSNFYEKENSLQNEKKVEGASLNKIELKITLNRISMLDTAAKISSSIFFLTMNILTYTHPSFTAIKVSFIAVEMICTTGKYIYTEAVNKAA